MADMIETLKGILGDNAEEKIGNVMEMLNSSENDGGTPNVDLIQQAQGLMQQLSASGNDNRSRLLMSLKPYMRENRRHSIDSAVKLLNLTKLSHLFKGVL